MIPMWRAARTRRKERMKKFLSVLGVAVCVFGLTACGSSSSSSIDGTPVDEQISSVLVGYGEQEVSQIQQVVDAGQQALVENDDVYKPAVESFETAERDLGTINGFIAEDEYAVQSDTNEYTVNIGIDGSDHDADAIIVYSVSNNQLSPTSITVNVRYSFGELMEQAGLNTVLGMGTTFCVLILLALLISLFKYIPKIQQAFSKKKEEPVPEPEAVPAAPATEEAEEPEAADDGALVAVIAAAIAASEGHTTTDGFVVRSIRKSRRKGF